MKQFSVCNLLCVVMGSLVDTNEITVIDFALIGGKSLPQELSSDVLRICNDLKVAMANSGVVYLVNHGISIVESKYVFSLLDQFLALPNDIKENYKSDGVKDVHGYSPQNSQKFSNKEKPEVRESFNITCFDRKFPDKEIPNFSKTATELFGKLTDVLNLFLELLSVGLGLKADYLRKCHNLLDRSKNMSILRLISYPPIEGEPSDGMIRIEEHTDYGTCTLLFQDLEGGLEVKGSDGEWRRVGYIPGAIFINTGELLDIFTSGEYKAVPHRVIVPPEKYVRCRTRHSMALFLQPDEATVVKPVRPRLVSEDEEYYTMKEHTLRRTMKRY